MSDYYPGYIFHDGDDYPEVAAWCNANGCYIKEITPDSEGRRFEIVKIPQKDLDTAKAEKIAELNAAKNHQLDTGGNFRLAGSDLPRYCAACGHCAAVDLKGKPRTPTQL